MKILDSDHCIAALKNKLMVQKFAQQSEIALTVISADELLYGAYRSQNTAKHLTLVQAFLNSYTLLPYEEPASWIFSKVKFTLERSGIPIPDADLHIASIALQHQAVLVTHNQRHFQRVPGLILEDWLP